MSGYFDMPKCLNLFVLALISLLIASCSSTQRFMNFGWSTPKQEVIDSIQRWGFNFNADKQRWEKGMLNGSECDKLKVWFSDKDLFAGAEAKYLDLDSLTSTSIRDRYVEQLTSLHGEPESVRIASGPLQLDRIAWSFSSPEDTMQDMIVLTHFPDYVIVHASRNMPHLFDFAPSSEE